MGVDLCGVERMGAALERTPGLAERLFSDAERAFAKGTDRQSDAPGPPGDTHRRPGESEASRAAVLFAVKEAVMKSMGVGMDSVPFESIEVSAGGREGFSVEPSGAAARRARSIGVRSFDTTVHMREGPRGPVACAEVVAIG